MKAVTEESKYTPMTEKCSRDTYVIEDKIYTEIIEVSNLYEMPRMHDFARNDEYQNCREYRPPQEHREAPKKSNPQLAHTFRDEQIKEEFTPVSRKNWQAIEIPKIKEDEIKENTLLTQWSSSKNKVSGVIRVRNIIYLSVGLLSLIGCATFGSLYLSRKDIGKSNIGNLTTGFPSTIGIPFPTFEVTTPIADNISTENSPYSGYKNNTTKKTTELTNNKFNNLGLTTKISDGLNYIFIHSSANIGDDKTKEIENIFKKLRVKFIESFSNTREKEQDLNVYLYKTKDEYAFNEKVPPSTHAYFNFFEKKIATYLENNHFLQVISHEYIHYLDNKFNTFSINEIKDNELYQEWRKNLRWWVEGIAEYMSSNFKKGNTPFPKENQLHFDFENHYGYNGYLRVHAFFESSEELIKVRSEIIEAIRRTDFNEFMKKITNFKNDYAQEYITWLKS